MSAGARRLLLAGYVFTTFLSFPHPLGGFVLDLGVVMAWLGPACLILALRDLPPVRAAWVGFAAGLLAHAAILHWIYVVTVYYGHAAPLLGVLAPFGLAAYLAAFPALFAAGWAVAARRGLAGPLAAALLWTALDHLRSFALSGFPWATLGYAQHANEALVPVVAWTGVYGLSFVTVLGGAALAAAVEAHSMRLRSVARVQPTGARRAAVAVAGVVIAHGVGGALARSDDPPDAGMRLRVAALQGNIGQDVKWSPAWAERTLETYEELTRRAAGDGAQLVVWPETAVPGSIITDATLRDRLEALARSVSADLVVGAVGITQEEGQRHFYDSAFVLGRDGRWLDRYDKSHLVPFGEYVPLRSLLGLVLRAVARGIAPDNVTPGPAPRALSLPPAAPGDGEARFGVPICYELIFPDLVRRFVRDGAGLLLAITNDAWYGRTGAPYQFLAMTALRSAENRVWTVRAANTGVSAIIDHRGRVLEQTPIFERDYIVADVPLRVAPVGGSFYTRNGDVFAAGCWAGVAWLAGVAAWRSRRGRET